MVISYYNCNAFEPLYCLGLTKSSMRFSVPSQIVLKLHVDISDRVIAVKYSMHVFICQICLKIKRMSSMSTSMM